MNFTIARGNNAGGTEKGSVQGVGQESPEKNQLISLQLVPWKHTATFLPCAEEVFFRKAPSHDKRWNKPGPTI